MSSHLRYAENAREPTPLPYTTPPLRPALLALPSEIIDQILDHLPPLELAQVSQISHRFRDLVYRDSLWESHVQRNLSTPLKSASPYKTFRDLYKAHHPYWFLTRRKLWISDNYPHGKLLLARYDHRSGSIEAYALASKPYGSRSVRVIRWEHDVVYQSFDPLVQLDLNQPVVRLLPEKSPLPGSEMESWLDQHSSSFSGTKYQAETQMQIPSSLRSYVDHLNRTFMHTRELPPQLCDTQTSLWPPMVIPSPGNARTRASSNSAYSSSGHKPATFDEASDASFRLRQRLNFHPFTPLQSIFSSASINLDGLAGDQVDTYGTVDPKAYTPTPEKPWQGIYVGDYSAHGCEFLLVTQPDEHDARPLPHKARQALERWPHSTDWQALNADEPGEEDELSGDDDDEEAGGFNTDTSLTAAMQIRRQRVRAGEDLPEVFPDGNRATHSPQVGSSNDKPPFKGRLEAVKLTGDPNGPRGEITFLADDLGERGFVGYTKERDFVESKAAAEGRLDEGTTSPDSGNAPMSPRSDTNSQAPPTLSPLPNGMAQTPQTHFVAELEGQEPQRPLEDDPDFAGSRIVRSVGHVCEILRAARRESYIPSQLIMISPGKLAQYWMPFQHVSFYERIDWEKFLKVDHTSQLNNRGKTKARS